MGCNWGPVKICPLGCRYTTLIAQAGSPWKWHLKMFPTGSPCSASLSAGSGGQPKRVKHNTIPSSLKTVNANTNSWPLWYENEYAKGDRKGNHQHPSFMFSINRNLQNLSSLLETDEWLIPFAAATFTAAASIRNNTKKSISIKRGLCPQHPPPRGAWQMIWENFWKISHHPTQPLYNYPPLSQAKPLAGVCWLQCS